ncbi:MAG TPA: cohesin domain-containing protein, partial [Candidatus Polarisedimenticolaceae bacterium]|nr:cohesin domain-containing protein [Candidatus Polarisedimenticolaceae bacterium]
MNRLIVSTLKRRFFFVLLCALLGLAPQGIHAAAKNGSLSISPSSGNYVIGSTFTVAVNEDSGQGAVNAVQADLSYDPAQLEFVGIDTGSSAFDIRAVESGGSGKVSMVRAKLHAPLNGNQLVGS